MEFFSQNQDGQPIPNPINIVDIHGDTAEDRFFKFLLTTIKNNKQIFDILYHSSGIHDVTDIPHIYFEEWEKIYNIMSPTNKAIFLRLFKNYINELPDPEVKNNLMETYQQLYSIDTKGGKRKKKTKRTKKHIKKGNKKRTKKYY
jgi:hypothetical protein